MATKASRKHAKPVLKSLHDLFVIMPFSATKSCTEDQWTDIFENVFSPAAEAAGLTCSRARVSTGSLIKSILERLRTSYIVLVDITDANPNVFYELGVRHSLSKRTIIVAQGASHIPSDLRGYWSLIYGTGPGQVKKFTMELKSIVDEINSEPEKPDSPVGDFLDREFLSGMRQSNIETARKLSALHTELTGILIELGRQSLSSTPTSLTEHSCLSMLLDLRYLDPGPETLSIAYEARDMLRHVKSGRFEPMIIVATRKIIEELSTRIAEIRQRVSQGTFSEPEQLSVMEWLGDDSTLPLSNGCRMNRDPLNRHRRSDFSFFSSTCIALLADEVTLKDGLPVIDTEPK